jgi:iron complex outermembrane receptor protein
VHERRRLRQHQQQQVRRRLPLRGQGHRQAVRGDQRDQLRLRRRDAVFDHRLPEGQARRLEETDANPISIFDARYIAEQDTTSQEFRLQSNGATALRWVAGSTPPATAWTTTATTMCWKWLRVPDPVNNPTGMDPANSVGVFGWPLHQKTTSYAAFGQVDYDLTPKLTLTGGLRWSQDKKTFHYVSDVDYGLLTLFEYDNEKTFSSISGRLGLRYAISDDANVYATYNRGTKSGGFFSGQTTDPDDLGPYRTRRSTPMRSGAKSEFLDRRLRVNVSAFYYDYKDLQVYTVIQRDGLPVQLFTNASKARVYGGEAEIEARPITGLSLTLGASLLSAEYKDFQSIPGRRLFGQHPALGAQDQPERRGALRAPAGQPAT